MYNFNIYWTDKLKINYLQRVILMHSHLYYIEDNPLISDKDYDSISKQLVELQKGKGVDWIKETTQYGYVFYDFDGSTGFDLYDRLNENDKKYIKILALNCLKGM